MNTTGHLPKDAWRRIWKRAVQEAGLPFTPTAYQMRHTHASWLIDMGEDAKTVMSGLGYHNLAITSKYVQLVDTGESAADRMEVSWWTIVDG